MPRNYTMRKRAEAHGRTRDRIVQATLHLHDEKGVAPTTFCEIAERAGVGPATVNRHFPTVGALVQACGAHVWNEMRPPVPDTAAQVFEGTTKGRTRLERLVEELDAFYQRGAHRLALAARDRDLIPELDAFLTAVDVGVEALVREALAGADPASRQVRIAVALVSFPVWAAVGRSGLSGRELTAFRVRLLECPLGAAGRA
jgi:AcrR family transcriptional regulator